MESNGNTSPDLHSRTSLTLTEWNDGRADTVSMTNLPLKKDDPSFIEAQPEDSFVSYPSQTMSSLQISLLMTGLALAMFTSSLNSTVVSPALSTIAADLDDLADQLWVATAYILTFNASQPLYGKFSDIFGRKSTMLTALGIFVTGALLSALAVNMIMLIVARSLQGIGGGGVVSMVLIIIADLFPVEKRLQYQSVATAMFGAASVVGPLMGGAFVDNLTWRWDFWIGVVLGSASFIGIFFLLKLKFKGGSLSEQIKRVDVWGTLMEIGAVVTLMLALNWGGSKYTWESGEIIGLLIVFLVLLAAFIFIEIKIAPEPVVPPRLFKNPTVVAVFICQFLLGTTFLGVLYFQPTYSQVVFAADATGSGIRLIPLMVSLVVFSIITAGLLPIVKKIHYFVIVGTVVVIGGLVALYTLGLNSTTAQQVGYMILCGAGLGCCFQMNILAAQAAVEKKDMAIATSLAQFSNTLGGAIGLALFGSILQNDALNGFASLDSNILTQAAQHGYTVGKSAVTQISLLPDNLRIPIAQVWVHGLQRVFLASLIIAAFAFLTSLLIRVKRTDEVEQNE